MIRNAVDATRQLFCGQGHIGRCFAAGAGQSRPDRDRLIRVMMNLLSNAVKVRRQIGRACSCRPDRERGRVGAVAVADNGPGILTNEQATVFERSDRWNATCQQARWVPAWSFRSAKSDHFGGRDVGGKCPGRGATFYFLAAGDQGISYRVFRRSK